MKRKIAVVVRERTQEALRMALGLTLLNDEVDVILLAMPPEESEQNAMNVEMLREMRAGLYSVLPEAVKNFDLIKPGELPERLLGYDLVIPY